MTGLLVLLLLVSALALAAVRWGVDTRESAEWRWSDPGRSDRRRSRAASLRRAVHDAWTDQVELQERLALLNRPWEEAYLHWSGDAADPRLHGSVPPPLADRRYSVTTRGWCPAGER